MTKDDDRVAAIRKAIQGFGLDLPALRFIERDALSSIQEAAQLHISDRTPVIIGTSTSDGSGEAPREICSYVRAMDIGGKAATGSDGRMQWRLTNYICGNRHLEVNEPVSFVATPRAANAVMMTSTTVSIGSNLVIEVLSWNPDGSPAPNTPFSWRCWFNSPISIIE